MKLENLIEPFARVEKAPPRTLGAFILWALSGTWPVLIAAAMISAVAGIAEVFTAFLLGAVIDRAVDSEPATFFRQNWGLVLLFVGFFIGIRPVLFGINAATTSIAVGPNINPMILSRLHRYTLGQAVTFFDDDFAGRIAQKQMQTSRALTDVAVETINVMAFALASLVGSAFLLTTIDWRVAITLVVWLVFYFALIRWFLPRIRLRGAARANARTIVSGQVVDTITNIKTVKLFALAEYEDAVALEAMEGFRGRALDFGRMAAMFRFLLMTIAGLLPVLLVGGALLLWTQGEATAGNIAAAGAVAIRIAQMTGWVSFTLMGLYSNIGEVEDGIRTLTPAHTLTNSPDARELEEANLVSFDNVSFAYGRDFGGIKNVTLDIHPGEKLAIVGASGAGKSTLVALLLRLYDPESGRVMINGNDLRDLTQESLRRKISMVTQETAMFNRSARDNILYGRPDATEEEMISAAKSAEAHEFILNLQDHRGRTGYEAHLGERGVKLSGGQRQRIALARSILKDAPVLVLDEATSALDSEVEAEIQSALQTVMQGKTVLAIAHRLSTIASMDRIVVLEEGEIVEEGTHKDLLKRQGVYFRYWSRQSGGFIGSEEAAE
ncbi:MAG: ABC transporter ATP-binding protein [Paracoccaceae bacterium]